MILTINSKLSSYPIYFERGLINKISSLINLQKYHKILVVTDDNIPQEYIDRIVKSNQKFFTIIIPHGEENKNINNYLHIQEFLIDHHFSRWDLVIAIGGGMIGDLACFASSTYMRGLDFINIPTSTVAMIDSSIGGKTAIDYHGNKNILGTFYEPKAVIIDLDLLKSLDERNFTSGLVEALKAGIISDEKIVSLFEDGYIKNLDEIIYRALLVKKRIVEKDVLERGERKLLNLGHTIGHGIEAMTNFKKFTHGEAVGLGMKYCFDNELDYQRIRKILIGLKLPVDYDFETTKIMPFINNDKKSNDTTLDFIKVKNIGNVYINKLNFEEIENHLKEVK